MNNWPSHYACAPNLSASAGRYSVRPIHWDDRESIRQWRNAQIDVLRQRRRLTTEDQDDYFIRVVRPQMGEDQPSQVLVAFLEDGRLVGYGGFVHFAWADRRAELSILTDAERLDSASFESDVRVFVPLLLDIGHRSLGLHKVTTETFAFRARMMQLLAEIGFEPEGTLREQYLTPSGWMDSHLHGRILLP